MKKCFEWLKNKKLRKQSVSVLLTGGLLTATMVAFLLSLNSLAWFSRNEKTNASGLMMKTKVTKNLVMVTDEDDRTDTSKWLHAADWTVDPVPTLFPTTRHDDKEGEAEFKNTDLYYVTTSGNISRSTGLQKTGKTFTYERIEADPANLDPATSLPLETPAHVYYLDFDFYIASQGGAIENGTLGLSIEKAVTAGTDPEDVAYSHKAATVEVFFPDEANDTTDDGYRGKCTVAGAKEEDVEDNGTVTVSGVNIPAATSENWLHIKLRVYFDGELKDPDPDPEAPPEKAYVNTMQVDLRGLQLELKITAEEN